MGPLLTVELERSSPIPLYFQVAEAFEKAIRDGRLQPGDRLENEMALSERLSVSRPTMRRAIQDLVDKGLLVRKRGVGTQVVQKAVHRPVALTSLFDDLISAGQKPTTKVLAYKVGPASEETANNLNLPPGADVVTIRRLRSSGGEPLAIMTNFLPAALAPAPVELEKSGLYRALRSRRVHIQVGRQSICAKNADREEALLLNEKPKAALLVMTRTAFDDEGNVVEYGRHLYRATRYSFETPVTPSKRRSSIVRGEFSCSAG